MHIAYPILIEKTIIALKNKRKLNKNIIYFYFVKFQKVCN